MKFTALVVSALAAVAAALPAFTNTEFNVEEGKPFTLTWIGTTNAVTLEVLSGPDDKSLNPVKTITTSATGSSFTYTPTDLPTGKYAFRITDNVTKENNYSNLFSYTGTAVSSSVVSSTRSATSTRASSSASSTTESSSTITSASSTLSTSRTTTTSATTTRSTPSNTPANNNEGQRFASPLALVFITVAALAFFN